MSLCYSVLACLKIFKIKVKRFYSLPKLDEFKNKKRSGLRVKLPWFISWLFQFIDLVVPSSLSRGSWPPADQEEVSRWAAVTSLGRSRGALAHRSWRLGSAQEKLFLTQACSSTALFLSAPRIYKHCPQAPL